MAILVLVRVLYVVVPRWFDDKVSYQSFINVPHNSNKLTWLGADVATSVPINSHRVLWLFGDTLWGTTHAGKRYINFTSTNSLGLMHIPKPCKGGEITKYLGPFNAPHFKQPIWLMSGVMYHHQLILLARMIASSHRLMSKGAMLIVVNNPQQQPDVWQFKQYQIPTYANITLSTALVHDHQNLYIVGEKVIQQKHESCILIVPINQAIHGNWRERQLKMIDGLPGSSELAFGYLKQLGWYTLEIPPFTAKVHLYSAAGLLGPWKDRGVIARLKTHYQKNPFIFYAVKSHPELSCRANEIIYTYNSNVTPFVPTALTQLARYLQKPGYEHIYVPQFMRYYAYTPRI